MNLYVPGPISNLEFRIGSPDVDLSNQVQFVNLQIGPADESAFSGQFEIPDWTGNVT